MRKKPFLLENHWYRCSLSGLTVFLLPFSWLFALLVALRYFFYRHVKKSLAFSVPVIVVGNITVGGTGKTPFVIALTQFLQKHGFRPGIVSRGAGGVQFKKPYWVDVAADPAIVGDEALLLARRTACPLVVCWDRVSAVQEILRKTDCNIIISDDGLQHYRLARALEIVIIDGERKFGNGHLLPAGPLREPITRLDRVDLIVINGQQENFMQRWQEKVSHMSLQGDQLISLQNADSMQPLANFRHSKVHAVAGIGNPERFFTLLRKHNIELIEHVFADHYLYQAEDLEFFDDLPIIMTEKDAVKCQRFAKAQFWYLPVTADISDTEQTLERWRQHYAYN